VSVQILYLSYDGINDPLGQSQVLPYLTGLAKIGYKIHLISAEKQISNRKAIQIKEVLKQKNINWNYINYTKNPPIISTLFDIWKINNKIKETLKLNQIQLIHCRGYITSLLGLYYKKKRKIPFLFDMRGFFADERKDSTNWNINNPIYYLIYKWFKKRELDFFKHADYIISLTKRGEQIIKNEITHNSNLNIEIIPCCVDLIKFDYNPIRISDTDKVRTELNIEKKAKVFTYLGSLGTWYMIDEMLQFFKKLSELIPDSIFLFITNDSEKIILEAIDRNQSQHSKFRITKQPSNKVPLYLSVSDWGLFFILPAFSKKASSPTKLAEFFAMGIPVITNSEIGDVDEIVNMNNAGIVISDFSENEINKAAKLCIDFEKQNPAYYRMISERNFDVEDGILKYSSVYKRIIKS
jgi:glycosyltransferase involved in cell wall biosynthesis